VTSLIRDGIKRGFLGMLRPIANLLVRMRVRPDTITVAGLILNLGAAYGFAMGRFRTAAILVLLAGSCDMLDGLVARTAGNGTRFGAFLDSTIDRYSEIFLWFGIAVYCFRESLWVTSAALYFALAGSLMVSYVRARAEGLGEECKVGFMQRPERILCIGIGALIGRMGITVVIWLVALLSNYTVAERFWHMWKKSKDVVVSR